MATAAGVPVRARPVVLAWAVISPENVGLLITARAAQVVPEVPMVTVVPPPDRLLPPDGQVKVLAPAAALLAPAP